MKSRSRYMCRIRKALYLNLRKMMPGKTANTLGLSVMRSFKTENKEPSTRVSADFCRFFAWFSALYYCSDFRAGSIHIPTFY